LAFAFYRERQTITRAGKTIRHAACTKHLSGLTALPKTIFDKQLTALGQLQNKLGSLNPAKSKGIGLDSCWSIQLGAHSEKGAKRVKPLLKALRLF
jgi:hypothetical protein